MEIVFDLNHLLPTFGQEPLYLIWYITTKVWIVFVLLFIYFGAVRIKIWWLENRQNKYAASLEFVLLAIDIPKVNESGPKIVEHLFTTISGAHSGSNLPDKWIKGKFQETFSFEIVSTGGYIQFFIRTAKHFRNLVEASIYSQYPDAEISEAEDYTNFAPDDFPDDEYDMWATELTLVKDWAYPIKTYPYFEDDIEEPGTKKFKDPMAAMMEVMSRLTPDEHLWYQIVVEPILPDWAAHSKAIVEKLLGRKTGKKQGFLVAEINQWLHDLWYVLFSWLRMNSEDEKQSMSSISGGEKKVIDAIEEKASKQGFNAKIRFIYIAKQAAMNKPLGVSGFFGALKQYNTVNLNAFKPDSKLTTSAPVYGNVKKRVAKRQKKNMANYKARALHPNSYVLNVEELASLYHFPVAHVKNTMIKTANLKRINAPISLPTTDFDEETQIVEELVEPIQLEGNEKSFNLKQVKPTKKSNTTPVDAVSQIKKSPKTPMNLPVIK